MVNELQQLIKEGGTKVFTTYAVEIGDVLWSALYSYIETAYPDSKNQYCSRYGIEGIYEENDQKFAILIDRASQKYYRLNFSLTETEGFNAEAELVEVTKTYAPVEKPQFDPASVEAYIQEYAKKKEEEEKNKDKSEQGNKENSENSSEDDEDEEKKKKKFSYDTLEEIPEYVALQETIAQYTAQIDELKQNIATCNNELDSLRNFKKAVDKKAKEDMIAKFYMLSDEDKADVINNIDTYSLDDIEAKLSIICVRNKISFTADDDEGQSVGSTTFSLDDAHEDDSTPAWVKAALNVAKNMNN